jgi:hypothetical protein
MATYIAAIMIALFLPFPSTSQQMHNQRPHAWDSLKIVPRESFDLNSLIATGSDTLGFVICADYVYSPFGNLRKKTDLHSSLLKRFNVASTFDTMDNGVFEIHRLKFKSSKLILFFDDDPEASRESYILKGQIRDKEVKFINGIHLGMSLRSFLETFLVSFPEEIMHSCNAVILESCVTGIRHIYSFEAGKLKEVRFECVECYWKL